MTGHSERLNRLAATLARVQGELRPVIADADGDPELGRPYRYATLSCVWNAIRPLLTANGLSVVQTCEPSERNELRLTTTLLHESGQWIAGTMTLPIAVHTAQGFGSALTYARRYALAALLGLCVEDDDDGAAASQLVGLLAQREQHTRPRRDLSRDHRDGPAGG